MYTPTFMPGEAVIQSASGVAVGNGNSPYTDDLYLTNMRIISVKKGVFGNVKKETSYNLSDITIFDNVPQVRAGRKSNGMPVLEIYFSDGSVAYFSFNSFGAVTAKKWVNAIISTISKTNQTDIPHSKSGSIKDGYNPKDFAIPGADVVAETLKGTIDTFKDVFSRKSASQLQDMEVSGYCPNCGVSITGIKGRPTRCPYCGSFHTFN